MAPVSLAVIGAGQRGTGYARWARRHPDRASVVAVAEPRQVRRARFAAEHGIGAGNAVADWRQLADRGRLADAVLICTQDRLHAEPAEAFAALGYHILLEKPMAPDEAACRRIVAATEEAGVMLAVGHVMRYTPYTRAVKEIVEGGQLGDIMSVQHLEPVGFWHQAHAYVRGNWRRADLAASMLMAKSCHDLDWLQYILGRAPLRVSSFGRLTHFTAANRPAGAADRCVDCSVEASCPYSAPRLYRDLLERGEHRWPLSVVIEDFSPGALDEALRHGPYGRCVYACDNDVVDHQVVALEFPGATAATFTMTAFTKPARRSTRLFGTRAELAGDGETIRVYDFLTRAERLITTAPAGAMNAAEGHGGGDAGLMDAFTGAVATGHPELIMSGPRESLASHLSVFAAERARLNGTVETIPPYAGLDPERTAVTAPGTARRPPVQDAMASPMRCTRRALVRPGAPGGLPATITASRATSRPPPPAPGSARDWTSRGRGCTRSSLDGSWPAPSPVAWWRPPQDGRPVLRQRKPGPVRDNHLDHPAQIVMAVFPRACPAASWRMAWGTSASG